ncbi:muraminidase [Burkholderia sp. SRS-W-2-2016]|nr:muraminidase [Burkholderia sp. SRS-W-2-2016]
MSDGFFPLGVNGFPHGGIHFGAGSASRVDQSKGVRVIADGDIVAYKLDDAYSQLHFTQTRDWALYSTGFVLVRHKLTMPRAQGSTAAQPADETLTFFSLYMHIADWCTYLADDSLDRPGWWLGVDAFRIKAKDKQVGDGGASGAVVYTAPAAGTRRNTYTPGKPVGFLPEGSEVTIGETRGPWGHIKAVTSGTMVSPSSGGYFGWEDGPQAPWLVPDGVEDTAPTLTPEGDWGWINTHDHRALKEPTNVGTVVIPPKERPIHVQAGTLLGQLGEYIDYETSTPLPPAPLRQLLHLEVFADDSLKAFIEKSRARVAQLPQSDKTIFVIQAGAKLVTKPVDADIKLGDGVRLTKLTLTSTSPKTGTWIQVQPWINGPSGREQQYQGPVWIARSGLSRLGSPTGLSAWKAFPLQLSQAGSPVNADLVTYPRAELNSLGDGNVAVDDKGVTWWRLEVGTGAGQAATGWVCGGKQTDGSGSHPGTRWESPWAWPGFEIVDATGISLTDAFKRNLSVTGSASPNEQKAFAPSTAAVGSSALLLKLEQTVSRLPASGGVKDDKGKDGSVAVTAAKLQQALTRRWLANDLGHVILKYESEWGGGTSRWEALTPLMRNAAENWKCELERIKKLQWWDSVQGKVDGFPSGPVVNHLHPIAVAVNFILNRKRRDYDLGKLSTQYETSGRGPSTVSGGQGDPGGVSYGSYQMTSKTRRTDGTFVIGGTVQIFVTSPDFPWTSDFSGLTPGTPAFTQKWREVVQNNTNKFVLVEHEYMKKTHFDVQIRTVMSRTGVDLRYHSHTINDVVWSTAVHHGPTTDVIATAIGNLNMPNSETRDYDQALIDAIYAERGKTNAQGQVIRFRSSSAAVQAGILQRFRSEKPKAQDELRNENDY